MNGAHWHLLLNHLPVLGIPFGLALLAAALYGRNTTLQRAGLVVLVCCAFAAGAAYLTGEPAEHLLKTFREVPESLVEPHEDAATYALVGAILLGLGALAALWRSRRAEDSRRMQILLLVAGLVVAVMMARTALLGGRIGHPEIRSEAPIP